MRTESASRSAFYRWFHYWVLSFPFGMPVWQKELYSLQPQIDRTFRGIMRTIIHWSIFMVSLILFFIFILSIDANAQGYNTPGPHNGYGGNNDPCNQTSDSYDPVRCSYENPGSDPNNPPVYSNPPSSYSAKSRSDTDWGAIIRSCPGVGVGYNPAGLAKCIVNSYHLYDTSCEAAEMAFMAGGAGFVIVGAIKWNPYFAAGGTYSFLRAFYNYNKCAGG